MEEGRAKLQRHWEKMFPAIDDEWTHWWIFAEGLCVGVILGSNLLAVLDVVEDNYEKYPSIRASLPRL